MVAGPGGGHVEKSQPLMAVHLLLDGLEVGELGGLDALLESECPALAGREEDLDTAGAGAELGGQAGEDGDGKLQAFGAVDGEDAHRFVVGLGQHGLHHPGAFGRLQSHPSQVVAQGGTAGLLPGAALVDDEAQPPPQVPGSLDHERHFHEPAFPHDPLEHLAGRQPQPLAVELPQPRQALGDRVLGGAPSGKGVWWSQPPP